MARRPMFPRTPQENAIDKLLNQTLPQLLQQKEARNERDEQKAESLRRYEDSRKDRFNDQQERRMLHVDSEMNQIEDLLADGNLVGYESRVERLGKYTQKYGITGVDFNSHDYIEKGIKSQEDHKNFGNIRRDFYLAKNPDEVMGYLSDLENLAADSPYISEKEIAWAFEDIQKNPDREQYKNLSGVNLNPKEWAQNSQVRASYHSQTAVGETSGGLWTQAHISSELKAMDAEYYGNITSAGTMPDNMRNAETYYTSLGMNGIIPGGPQKGMTVKQAISERLEERNSSAIQNVQEQYKSHFQTAFDGNFRDYAFDKDDNQIISPYEHDLIDKTSKHWAYVELYGPTKANEIKSGRLLPTPEEQLKAEELRRDELGFPQEYVDFAKQYVDEKKVVKTEEEKRTEKIKNMNFSDLENREAELTRQGIREGLSEEDAKELAKIEETTAKKNQLEVKSVEEVVNETQQQIDDIKAARDRYKNIVSKRRNKEVVTKEEMNFVKNYNTTLQELGVSISGSRSTRKSINDTLRELEAQKEKTFGGTRSVYERGKVSRREKLDTIEKQIKDMGAYKRQGDGTYRIKQWGPGRNLVESLAGKGDLYDEVITEKEYKDRMKSLQRQANQLRKEFAKDKKESKKA